MAISERIRQLRGKMSRREFAGLIGISQASVQNYEKGLRIPDANAISAICEQFRVSADWLLFGEPSAPKPEAEKRKHRKHGKKSTLFCSFCGKGDAEVNHLIQADPVHVSCTVSIEIGGDMVEHGITGTAAIAPCICDECVAFSRQILLEEKQAPHGYGYGGRKKKRDRCNGPAQPQGATL